VGAIIPALMHRILSEPCS